MYQSIFMLQWLLYSTTWNKNMWCYLNVVLMQKVDNMGAWLVWNAARWICSMFLHHSIGSKWLKESGRCVHTSEIGVKFQVGAGMTTIFQVDCKQTAESAEKNYTYCQESVLKRIILNSLDSLVECAICLISYHNSTKKIKVLHYIVLQDPCFILRMILHYKINNTT